MSPRTMSSSESSRRRLPVSRDFKILLGLLIMLFVAGGASRTDVQSLVFLRPITLLVAIYGATRLRSEHLRRFPVTFALLGAATLLTALHLVPLPPSVWTMLPGRALIADIDRAAGTGPVWRPLSMVPSMTRNALYALAGPIAVLLLAAGLTDRDRTRLIPVFIVFGAVSGLVGMLQLAGGSGSLLFLYAQTTTNTANGLFANRNHQGVLLACMFPLVAAYALGHASHHATRSAWLCGAAAIVLVPLVLIVGSRAGLLCMVLAIVLSPFLALDHLSRRSSRTRRIALLSYVAGCAVLLVLGVVFVLASRAESIQRLMATDTTDDRRLMVWEPVLRMIREYLPFGSGIGSYIKVFQIGEPHDVLALTYSNHVHNDWLEVVMTAGIPGLLLLVAATLAVTAMSWRAWQRASAGDPLSARTATIVLLLLALASIGDYPLRVPSMMALCVVALLWLEAGPVVDRDRKTGRASAGSSPYAATYEPSH